MTERFGPYPYHPFDGPTTPPVPENTGGVCFTVDKKWVPYLIACAYTLTAKQTWASDTDRAIEQAQDIILMLEQGIPCNSDITPIGSGGGDDCMGCCIRIENGHLQTLNCGVWEDVPGGDLSEVINSTPTSPDVVPTPGAGECAEFWLECLGTLPILLPIGVSTGDSIEIDEWRGTWSDGTGAAPYNPWFCADGNLYVLGQCTGISGPISGDPMPTANHMSIVAQVGGAAAFLAPMGSARYVPPGVTDAPVYFQANDTTLGDNLGGVNFHVKICKAADAPIGLSYGFGNGPLSANVGDVFTVTSQASAGAGSDQTIQMTCDPCCVLTVVSETGWSSTGGDTGSPGWLDCVGTTHSHSGTDVAPSTYIVGRQATLIAVNGLHDAVFQIQVRIDAKV